MKNKQIIALLLILIFNLFSLSIFAEHCIEKEDFPNIPCNLIDQLLEANVSISQITTINNQIAEYNLSKSEIESYVNKITKNIGEYPHDHDLNTITPNGIIPYQDLSSKWHKIGDHIGDFKRIEKRIKLHDINKNKITYLPAYLVNNEKYFCLEDLTNSGYSHYWDEHEKKCKMTYDGKTYKRLPEHKKSSGKIHHSNIKTYINNHRVHSYNIGGYSLVKVDSLKDILKNTHKVEIVGAHNNIGPVDISLPSFKITLNGHVIDNSYNKYPLLVYKDITYFPMTYHGARFLGLKANWYEKSKMYHNKGVLFIGTCSNSEKQSTFKMIRNNHKNHKHDHAHIASYGLALNTVNPNNFIRSEEEEYPILNFRGITYFPLTWKYAVDQFGWEYSYTHEEGLKINSVHSSRKVIDDSIIGN